MTPYENLCDALNLAQVKYQAGPFREGINWYNFSEKILNQAVFEITLLDGVLVFDIDGIFIADGSGDEQPVRREYI